MAFYGKVFTIEKDENFDGFVKALGIPEERATKLLEYKPTQKIEKNGDEYTFSIDMSGKEKVYKFKSGVEFTDTFRDLPVKITITVDGNKVTQIMNFEIGFTITVKKEYSDDSFMSEEITHSGWDGVARRTYNAQ